jgi:hypothetical protein
MKLMCAMLVSEWRFELANIFAPLRERYLKLDTIPKPRGLDSDGPRGTRFIGSAFIEYSMNIRRLSNACSMMLQRKYGR